MTEQIARGEALRDALLYAPLQHFFLDTVTNVDGFWVARCNCGYRTLGYGSPERAQQALDKFHTGVSA